MVWIVDWLSCALTLIKLCSNKYVTCFKTFSLMGDQSLSRKNSFFHGCWSAFAWTNLVVLEGCDENLFS